MRSVVFGKGSVHRLGSGGGRPGARTAAGPARPARASPATSTLCAHAMRAMYVLQGRSPAGRSDGRASDLLVLCAPGRIRTCDTRFRRAVLYPLSYGGGACVSPSALAESVGLHAVWAVGEGGPGQGSGWGWPRGGVGREGAGEWWPAGQGKPGPTRARRPGARAVGPCLSRGRARGRAGRPCAAGAFAYAGRLSARTPARAPPASRRTARSPCRSRRAGRTGRPGRRRPG